MLQRARSFPASLTSGMTHGTTRAMSVAKVTISIDQDLLRRVDKLVDGQVFHSRSAAIQAAVEEKIIRIDKSRLARECAKLDKAFEQALADEGLAAEIEEWAEY